MEWHDCTFALHFCAGFDCWCCFEEQPDVAAAVAAVSLAVAGAAVVVLIVALDASDSEGSECSSMPQPERYFEGQIVIVEAAVEVAAVEGAAVDEQLVLMSLDSV